MRNVEMSKASVHNIRYYTTKPSQTRLRLTGMENYSRCIRNIADNSVILGRRCTKQEKTIGERRQSDILELDADCITRR